MWNIWKEKYIWSREQLQIGEKVQLNDKSNKYGKQSSLHSTLLPPTILCLLIQNRKKVDVLSAEHELGSCILPSLGRSSLSKSRQMELLWSNLISSCIMIYSVCFCILLHLKYVHFPLFCTFRASSSYNF